MKTQLTKEQALYKITAYCSLAEHCLSEVRKKLEAWEMSEDDIQSIVAYLLKEKYVDEERYTRAFAKEKLTFAKWGKTKVSFALRRKGIDASVVTAVLDDVFGEVDYDESISQVLSAKFRSIKYKDKYDAKAKLLRFGAGRGFEFQKMLPVVEKLVAGLASSGVDDDF